jgi:DNA-binding GntR family transcriptional regulator
LNADIQQLASNQGVSRPKRSLVDEAYAELKRRIVYNELPSSHQALEEELAAELGMSRTPVREALIRLENEGFVDVIPRRGMRVKPVTETDIREINEVLSCLESGAAERLALRRPGPEEMARLEAAIAAMDAALEADDMQAWSEADYRFHRLLVEMAGNRQLAEVALNFLEKAHRIRLLTTPLRSTPVYSNVNHAAVVEAIRRGDAQTAVEIHRGHKRRWGRELNEVLERLDLAADDRQG